jgi:hypothetical protein
MLSEPQTLAFSSVARWLRIMLTFQTRNPTDAFAVLRSR